MLGAVELPMAELDKDVDVELVAETVAIERELRCSEFPRPS
jgi:hypothetical protein